MPKKKTKGDVYRAATRSPIIAKFQKLLNDKGGHFPWTQMVDEKEMRFIYDLVSRAEAEHAFMPSSAQAEWGIQILWKLEGAAKQWKSAHGTTSKMPSAEPIWRPDGRRKSCYGRKEWPSTKQPRRTLSSLKCCSR